MTDQERRKAVAEKILGWHQARKPGYAALYLWCNCRDGEHGGLNPWADEEQLDSWLGIGLIVEAMVAKGLYLSLDDEKSIAIIPRYSAFFSDLGIKKTYRGRADQPWIAVQEAALCAVEGR